MRTWSSAGVAHHGVANPMQAVPVSTRARLAGLVLAGLRVVCLRSSGGCSCGCSWCAVVLAASWSAWSAWFSSRGCRWSYRQMLFVQPARPCRRWLVASRLVQVRRSAVRQRWLAAFVMVGSRCAVVLLGMVNSGRGAPRCRHPVGRRSRFDPCTPGWFGVGRLACGLLMVMWRLQLPCGWCAVVAAASWPAGFVWVPLRRCRCSDRQFLLV